MAHLVFDEPLTRSAIVGAGVIVPGVHIAVR
jgi:hypothetical protein